MFPQERAKGSTGARSNLGDAPMSPKRRVAIEAEPERRRKRKRVPGRGSFQGRPTIDFKTTKSFHAVDLADARELARRLRDSGLAGIARRIEDAIADGTPFVPAP